MAPKLGRPNKYKTDEERQAAKRLSGKKHREKKKEKIKKDRKVYLKTPQGQAVTKSSRNTWERKHYSVKSNRDKRNESVRLRRSEMTPEEKKQASVKRGKRRTKLFVGNTRKIFKILGGPKCAQCGFQDTNVVIDTKTKLFDIGHREDTGYLDAKQFDDVRDERSYYATHPHEVLKYLFIQCMNCNQIQNVEAYKKKWSETKHTTKQISNHQRYHNKKKELFDVLGGPMCVICQQVTDERALTFGHKLPRGGKRKDISYYFSRHDEAIEIFQVECANCNNIKDRTPIDQKL